LIPKKKKEDFKKKRKKTYFKKLSKFFFVCSQEKGDHQNKEIEESVRRSEFKIKSFKGILVCFNLNKLK